MKTASITSWQRLRLRRDNSCDATFGNCCVQLKFGWPSSCLSGPPCGSRDLSQRLYVHNSMNMDNHSFNMSSMATRRQIYSKQHSYDAG